MTATQNNHPKHKEVLTNFQTKTGNVILFSVRRYPSQPAQERLAA